MEIGEEEKNHLLFAGWSGGKAILNHLKGCKVYFPFLSLFNIDCNHNKDTLHRFSPH